MALINCPECSKEINDNVKNCPHCGYPMKKPNEKKIRIRIISLVIYFLITALLGIIMYLNYSPNYNIDKGIIAELNMERYRVTEIEEAYKELHVQCKVSKFFRRDLEYSYEIDRSIDYLVAKAEYCIVGSEEINKLFDLIEPFYCENKYHLGVKHNSSSIVVDKTYYELIGNIEKSLQNVKNNYCQKEINFSCIFDVIILFAWSALYFICTKRIIYRNKENTHKITSLINEINNGGKIMYCRKCGYHILGNDQYCEHCGIKISSINVTDQTISNENEIVINKKKKKNKTVRIIIGIFLLCLLLVSLFLVIIMPKIQFQNAMSLYSSGQYEEALSAFSNLNTKESQNMIIQIQQHFLDESTGYVSTANIGDVISFGNYDWIVLKKSDGRALVITQECIEDRPYNTIECNVTWEDCSLRQYLNTTFYDTFSISEKSHIVEVTLDNSDLSEQSNKYTISGNDTRDKIFLLSINEVEKLMTKQQRSNEHCYLWWLRNPGFFNDEAAFVEDDGDINHLGMRVSADYWAVRPALWIDYDLNSQS